MLFISVEGGPMRQRHWINQVYMEVQRRRLAVVVKQWRLW